MIYKLPNNTVTNDVNKYVKSWSTLAAPIEKAFEARLVSFDPIFMFALKNGQTFDLPVEAVVIFNRNLSNGV